MTSQGNRIKYIRTLLGLSQEAFGNKINVSKQYVSNLEADRNFLNNDKLVSLLVDLNVNANYILNGVGEPFINISENSIEVRDKLLKDFETALRNHGI